MELGKHTVRAVKLVANPNGPEQTTVYAITEPSKYSKEITGYNDRPSLENWVKEYIHNSLAAKSWLENTEDEKEDLSLLSEKFIFTRPEWCVEEYFTITVHEHPNGDLIWAPLIKGRIVEELWRG